MKLEVLLPILIKLAHVEAPLLDEDKNEAHKKYVDGARQMAALYIEVGNEGAVVSADVDPLLLAAIGYEESRHQPKVKDGDCSYLKSGTVCNAIGPMQLSRSTPGVLGNLDPEWKGKTLKDLRDPLTSVKGAYRLLKYWKDQCKGSTDTLLGNWSAGKCLGGPIGMGIRRCQLAKAMGEAAGVKVEGCTRETDNKHVKRLIRKLKDKKDAAPKAAPEKPTEAVKPEAPKTEVKPKP